MDAWYVHINNRRLPHDINRTTIGGKCFALFNQTRDGVLQMINIEAMVLVGQWLLVLIGLVLLFGTKPGQLIVSVILISALIASIVSALARAFGLL